MVRQVSIIIPCFNAAAWISETLSSALQPAPMPIEVIVVDDGSTDGSAQIVADEFPTVRLIRTPNRGVSAARNLGIESSRGKYIVFLDADDLLLPDKMERQFELAERSGADVVYGNWQRLNDHRPSETVERAIVGDPELALFTDFWCPTGAYLFRRCLVEKVGGFRPTLPVIQDARFALDCALYGGRFVHDPTLSCGYRVHTSGSVSTRSRVAFCRDCLTNALEVQEFWSHHGGLTPPRLAALMTVADGVARAAAQLDDPLFDDASRLVDSLRDTVSVPGGRMSRLATSLLGYRRVRRLVATAQRLWTSRAAEVR